MAMGRLHGGSAASACRAGGAAASFKYMFGAQRLGPVLFVRNSVHVSIHHSVGLYFVKFLCKLF